MATKMHSTREFVEDLQPKSNSHSLAPTPVAKESLDVEDEEFSPHERRKIIRKVDRRLLVVCGFLFAICVLDRAQLGIVAVAG